MLTSRQFEILRHRIDGLCYKEIAAKLHIEVGTVKFHMGQIYEKLGLRKIAKSSGISAVVWWAKNGAPDTWAEYVKLKKHEFDEVKRAEKQLLKFRRSA